MWEELKADGKVSGRASDGRLVVVKGSEECLGKIVDVKVTKAFRRFLEGELLEKRG